MLRDVNLSAGLGMLSIWSCAFVAQPCSVLFSETNESSIDIIASSPEQLGDPGRLLFVIFVICCCVVLTILSGRPVDSGNWEPVEVGSRFKRCCRTGVSRCIFPP